VRPMTSDEIRRTFLDFFAQRDHLEVPSFPLIPPANDPSALFIVAGMHPLKPYFNGSEPPPAARVTDCQKVFRTPDIDKVGSTTRHLTFFEMLGNFSFGDYFKADAVRWAWELSTQGFGFAPQDIWITVFAGDQELGLGVDEEAIEAWLEVGVPRERIVECAREENFWESGPTGPCGPCSELYLDRGLAFGKADDLPGAENERFLEYWNLVFMQFDQQPAGVLTPLPARNIDTGLGLNRLAAILQGKETVFETDQFAPLISLGEELSGERYGSSFKVDRALRVLADHTRAMTFLITDGVVPSNEDRGYVLRRVMRRAIQQGRSIGLERGFLGRYAELVGELMGSAYPELREGREAVQKWASAEEEGFGRALEQGNRLLGELIARARESGAEGIAAADAFMLHDTYGFPIDLTRELVAEEGLGVDEVGYESLMEGQRRRAREAGRAGGAGAAAERLRERALELSGRAGFVSEFVGYERVEVETTVGALSRQDGHVLVKLEESPFYAVGGGQVADAGWVECLAGDCRARVEGVLRLGNDQVVALVPERGSLREGERVHAAVDRRARHATACNHTATHLLHAALRRCLGPHVHQAGSYVGADKLRFDFTHGGALTPPERAEVEELVNGWILENQPVRALSTTLEEARALGAMALFGEKYGEVVRMVEIGDGSFSRELCGGTHVRRTAEIGLFRLTAETSSAANVRRIEAVTGPVAVRGAREGLAALEAAAEALRVPGERVPDAVAELRTRVRELERAARSGGGSPGAGASAGMVDLEALAARAEEVDGARVLVAEVAAGGGKALLELSDRLKGRLGDGVIVLASPGEGRVDLIVTVAPSLVGRGLRAGQIVGEAARAVGGGGGGRDTMARAGGREVEKIAEALRVARAAVEQALRS
jgi:alanyl-tRNA synthetase